MSAMPAIQQRTPDISAVFAEIFIPYFVGQLLASIFTFFTVTVD
jgi:hypothetical protein